MKEKWLPIKGYKGYYEVSNKGRVRSLDRTIINSRGKKYKLKGKILKPSDDDRGYLRVCLTKKNKPKNKKIHKLVAQHFVKNPYPKKYIVINHKDGDKYNNYADNLIWCTYKMNSIHAVVNGLLVFTLTVEDVIEIKKLIDEGLSNKSIAKKYKVTVSTINRIRNKTIWETIKLKEITDLLYIFK